MSVDYLAPDELARRARMHTWLTVGGGLVLLPLLPLTVALLGMSLPAAADYVNLTFALLGISIIPATVFALLRQPAMRRLFRRVSQLDHVWQRAAYVLLGTLLIFLAFVALATGVTLLYFWGQYHFRSSSLTDQLLLETVNIMLLFSMPWLLAALASAWYVNRDLL